MVTGPELEGDGVSLGGRDGIRVEIKPTLAGNNDVISRNSGASKGGSSEDGRETHYDW